MELRPLSGRKSGEKGARIESTQPVAGDDVPTLPATEVVLERWNQPRSNIPRLGATFVSFFVLGMNDASTGALIPYLEKWYRLSYLVVSLIFLAPCAGYSAAALLNATIHSNLGQRGIAIIASLCHIVYYMILALHPPYPVIVVAGIIGGFGNGLIDAGWCAWTGGMQKANVVQGNLQACYSLGATLSPLIATTMIAKAHLPWYYFHYVMISASVLELIVLTTTFWPKNGPAYRQANPRGPDSQGSRTGEAMRSKVTWLCAVFFLAYVGAEVALGGWIVTFMLRERGGSPFTSGISATGFWAGQCLGRAVLGYITERFGERLCVFVYLICSVVLQLLFWLVPSFIMSAVAVAFLGFFLGPIFPAGIIMATKLLPSHLHVSSIGFSTAIGGTGAAVIPFAVGAIAQAKGVWVLQPIILALLVVLTLLWCLFPRIKKVNTS